MFGGPRLEELCSRVGLEEEAIEADAVDWVVKDKVDGADSIVGRVDEEGLDGVLDSSRKTL